MTNWDRWPTNGKDATGESRSPTTRYARSLDPVSHVIRHAEAWGRRGLRDGAAVPIEFDGRQVVAVFQPDVGEHQRRQGLGLGAVVSTGLLYGLWLLPAHVPVPADALPEVKVQRLRSAPGWAPETSAGFERAYSPAGRVTALVTVARDARRALDRAAEQSAVFVRCAVVTSGSLSRTGALATEGAQLGVGMYHLGAGQLEEVVRPAPAVVGRPGVFRWWIAELAYEAWLQTSSQLLS